MEMVIKHISREAREAWDPVLMIELRDTSSKQQLKVERQPKPNNTLRNSWLKLSH